ncbi:hypothetical protein D3C81_654020 [compost metagenome]
MQQRGEQRSDQHERQGLQEDAEKVDFERLQLVERDLPNQGRVHDRQAGERESGRHKNRQHPGESMFMHGKLLMGILGNQRSIISIIFHGNSEPG